MASLIDLGNVQTNKGNYAEPPKWVVICEQRGPYRC